MGQSLLDRSAINFNGNDYQGKSYIEGNVVRDGIARVITIKDTNHLRVKNNVGYKVYGHNFYLEEGSEYNNVIENNLAIHTKQAWHLM